MTELAAKHEQLKYRRKLHHRAVMDRIQQTKDEQKRERRQEYYLDVVKQKLADGEKGKPRKMYCKRGHLRTPENIYPGGNCKICAAMLTKGAPSRHVPETQKEYNSKYYLTVTKVKRQQKIELRGPLPEKTKTKDILAYRKEYYRTVVKPRKQAQASETGIPAST